MRFSHSSRGVCWLVLTLISFARSQDEVEFFFSKEYDQCSYNGIQVPGETTDGGLCAWLPSIKRVYLCPAGPHGCWSTPQTCKEGDNAGSGQIKCSGAGNSKTWCCVDPETCTTGQDMVNVCDAPFENPVTNLTKAEATSLQEKNLGISSIPTTVSTGSTFVAGSQTSFWSTGTIAASSSTSAPSSSTTATTGVTPVGTSLPASSSTAAPQKHSGLSGGAIAGIVIAVVAAIIFGVTVGLFIQRRRARSAQQLPLTASQEKPNIVKEDVSTDMPFAPRLAEAPNEPRPVEADSSVRYEAPSEARFEKDA